ncbi:MULTISPECIES: MFS transporter [Glutamicibacter]|uniref:MFS superfamily transporter n=1 Tax=Glutamicibacter arilaitensis (strain DSM 16368 / CIP 108037 / IAM 15318 / JCM 13566 / NCIMB 14258 / Re117) TaxID=861360 RepID=A0ABM9PXD0_GLUAR|nr:MULTISPECIES: MFS transporter [Glutamicibacter]CBT75998.1 putative MFS superfamily transporter [Glutamicibacter arilaitensis Re117]
MQIEASSNERNSLGDREITRIRRKSISILAAGQILGGLGSGATLTLGSLLIVDISGLDELAGMAATMNTLGAAFMALPLAVLAQKFGRRISLSTGALIAASGVVIIISSAFLRYWPLLLLGMLVLGTGSAMNLQSRFAATDLSTKATRGRDLSVVVWSTTVGAVIGPNLFEPGEELARFISLPPFTGGFLIAMCAQLIGVFVYWLGLRPDPLQVAQHQAAVKADNTQLRRRGWSILKNTPIARRAVLTVALTHLYMVSLMSMTPIHMQHQGASLTLIGITISIHVAGMYALSPVFGWLTDKAGPRTIIFAGQALLITASVLVWSNGQSHTVTTLALLSLGLGWSAATVAGATMITGAVGIAERPQLQGTSDLCMNLAGVVGGLCAGPILGAVGFQGLAVVLLICAMVMIVVNLKSNSSNIVHG